MKSSIVSSSSILVYISVRIFNSNTGVCTNSKGTDQIRGLSCSHTAFCGFTSLLPSNQDKIKVIETGLIASVLNVSDNTIENVLSFFFLLKKRKRKKRKKICYLRAPIWRVKCFELVLIRKVLIALRQTIFYLFIYFFVCFRDNKAWHLNWIVYLHMKADDSRVMPSLIISEK